MQGITNSIFFLLENAVPGMGLRTIIGSFTVITPPINLVYQQPRNLRGGCQAF